VAIYPDHGTEVEIIIKKADTAMYRAKRDGPGGYLIYTNEMGEKDKYLYEIENRLKMALSNSEIEMHYQPILSGDGTVKGCEALMRWENSALGKISPSIFIPIAENSGEIHQLGIYAFNQALIVFKKWQKKFGNSLFMSINISAKQIEKENIVDLISEILNNHGLTGKCIHLEITESCSTENVINLKDKLSKLKEMGFLISIDDFGTGYSSFRQLRDSYIDFIKIDRSFVKDIDKKVDNRAIVKAMVALGKSIGAKIIAEGVETKEELEIMKRLGCYMYQGYFLKRPADEETIEAFIEDRKQLLKGIPDFCEENSTSNPSS
jgi:EAL domain-containing protein (putative c-di-GMP-specific phosphodiesterase class I)